MESKQWDLDFEKINFYEHGGTRTPDSQNRNLMLYPTELHAQKGVVIKKAKYSDLIKISLHTNSIKKHSTSPVRT